MKVRFANPIVKSIITYDKYLPPPGWIIKFSLKRNRPYYVNNITKISQWHVPTQNTNIISKKRRYKNH